jgi:2-dehydro-3-deoxyphosphogluconate aldolase/(4S)-4-hydroxy-2-oxoglutarate aldolase
MNIYEQIKNYKLVPVVVINTIDEAIPTMEALVKGGLPVAEITFRTECAPEALALIAKKFPDALIGAGTVINAEQCEKAIRNGAKFIVSPGLSSNVDAICKKHNIPYIPGVATPTEIMQVLDLGINVVKFFPASNLGGVKTLKAICSAFPQIEVMVTGGINEENVNEYLAFNKIIAVGGSWMMKGNPLEIENKTRRALEIIGGNK